MRRGGWGNRGEFPNACFLAEEANSKERTMLGRALRLIAASTALTFLSLSGASAGLLGWGGYGYGGGYGFGGGCCGVAPAPVNWGCASTCAPLAPIAYASHGCRAPGP